MDIAIHILIIIIIGLFFFIDKFSPSNNSMFIIILLTIFGFAFMMADNNIELVDYTSLTKTNSTLYEFEKTDITALGVGLFNIQSFLVLIYFFFLILSVTNIAVGDKIGK